MFWPIVLPVKITLGAIGTILIFAMLFAPLVRVRRSVAFFIVSGLAIVTFVPACTVVMKTLDKNRFGEFHYATTGDIYDQHAALYLPPAATNIHTNQQPNGIWATFQIDEPTLIAYMNDRWDMWGDSAVNRGEEWKIESGSLLDDRDIKFRNIHWELPGADIALVGPTAVDGAGFKIWYDRDSQTGTLWGCYW